MNSMTSISRLPRFVLAITLSAFASACSLDVEDDTPPVIPLELQQWGASLNIDLATMTKLTSGVYIKDNIDGTGAAVTGTPTIRFYYSGFLASGFEFETNVGDPDGPAEFGVNELISGFGSGLQGMKVGGKRRLVIPSALAYGSGSTDRIPPNANLVFDIELVGII